LRLAVSCWHCVKAVVVASVLLAIVGVVYVYVCADSHIRHVVERHLDDHYQQHRVCIRSARRVSARQIALRGLEIRDRSASSSDSPLLVVDEVLICCNTGIDDLVQLRFSLDRVTLRGVDLQMEHRADGSLNIEDLFPLPRLGDDSLITTIEGGRITYLDRRRADARPLKLADVSLQVEFPPKSMRAGQRQKPLRFQGGARGTQIQELNFAGEFDKAQRHWNIQGRLRGLMVAAELKRSVPLTWVKPFQQFGDYRTQADLQFELSGQMPHHAATVSGRAMVSASSISESVQFVVDGELTEGHLAFDSRLPFPLTEITAKIHCDNERFDVRAFDARCGRTTVSGAFRCDGYGLQHPYSLSAKANNVHLVEYAPVLDVLPRTVKQHWEKYNPVGEVSFQLNLTHDARGLHPDISVTCHDLSFTTPKINYRLHQGHGSISLKHNVLDVDLAAQASGQDVHIGGRIHHPGPSAWGRVELQSIDPIPINRTLSESLSPKARSILQAFQPRGSFMLRHARFERQDASEPWHDDLLLSLERCFIQHQLFPYPLSNVQGMLRMQDGEWTFYDLQGQNDSGYVVGHGQWSRTPDGGMLQLNFSASQINLEDELQNALSANARTIWTALRPRGTLDRVDVSIVKRGRGPCELHVVLDKQPAKRGTVGRSVAIHPTWFPYPLGDVTGQLVYDNGQMRLHSLRARHGVVQLVTGGVCQWDRQGAWQLRLEGLSVDRMVFDRELATALPEKLRVAVTKLQPQGRVNVSGGIAFAGAPKQPLSASWNVKLTMAGGQLNPGIPCEHIHGGVELIGSCNGDHFQSQGQLDVDSLISRGVQISDIQGPIWLDDSRVFLGSWSSRTRQQQLPPHVQARVFGGIVYADGQVPFDSQKKFEVSASLADADLEKASLLFGTQQSVSGKALGYVKLTGTGTGWHSLRGTGALHLREADIYQLPLMVSLLKLVKIRAPDRTAFTECDIRFNVSGKHLYFDPIKFKGDAISLVGSGDMDSTGELNVDFYAMVGREQLKLPLVRPVLGEASRQFMLINVSGPYGDPEMNRQPFPALNETIQQMFPEATRRPEERTSRFNRRRHRGDRLR